MSTAFHTNIFFVPDFYRNMVLNEEHNGANAIEPVKPKLNEDNNDDSRNSDRQASRKPKYKFRGEVSETNGHVYQKYKEINDKR